LFKKKLLVLGLCLFNFMLFGENAMAAENQIHIATPEVSDVVKNYAKDNIESYLTGYLSFEGRSINMADYKLLEPFQMISESNEQKTNIFPVSENGIVKYVFSVNLTEEGNYSTKLSKFLANEIESLKSTYDNATITFIEKNGDIYIENDDSITKIYTSPMRPTIEENVSQDTLRQEVDSSLTTSVELDELSNIKQSNIVNSRSITVDQTGTKINWNVTETQKSDEQWCSAYAAAMILNNKNDARPTTAKQMAQFAGKNKNQALSAQNVIEYANSRGVYPYYVNRPMNWQEVLTQVRKSNAIWGAWEGFGGNYQGKWHALDIIGTYKVPGWGGGEQRAYFVWNPWYTYPELCNSDNNTYYLVGSSFVWRYSVTNW